MMRERTYVSNVLRTGVLLSFVLLVGGLVASMFEQAAAVLTPASPGLLIGAALRLDSTALIHLGLLVLMLTPVARVVVLVAHFVSEREVPFALVSMGVLCLVIAAVVVGLF